MHYALLYTIQCMCSMNLCYGVCSNEFFMQYALCIMQQGWVRSRNTMHHYIVHYALCTVHYSLCTFTVQCAVCNAVWWIMHYAALCPDTTGLAGKREYHALCTVHIYNALCMMCIMQFSAIYYALCTMHLCAGSGWEAGIPAYRGTSQP